MIISRLCSKPSHGIHKHQQNNQQEKEWQKKEEKETGERERVEGRASERAREKRWGNETDRSVCRQTDKGMLLVIS